MQDNHVVIATASNIFLIHRQIHGYPRTGERATEFYSLLLDHIAFLALSLQKQNHCNHQPIKAPT
ncbi:MAG: hypothetical protein ACRERV_10575, partial [Methylococcales bacterium]